MKGRVVHVVSSEKWFWRVGSVVWTDSCWLDTMQSAYVIVAAMLDFDVDRIV